MTTRLRGLWAVLGAAALGFSAFTAPPAVAAPGDFITTWDTTKTSFDSSDQYTVELPLLSTGTYNVLVNWGDGQSQTITSATQGVHTYAVAGTKTITISGDLTGWSFLSCDVCAYNGDRTKILEVVQWGDLHLGNSGGYFAGAENLTIPATDEPDLTGTTDMDNAFWQAKHLTGGLAGWNTSAVTTMSGMFDGASLYNDDISTWDTGSVTRMDSMFRDAAAFDQPIGGWDTSALTDMSGMFQGATSFNQPLADWDVSHVTGMDSAFRGAASFDQALDTWQTGAVTSMVGTFGGATAFDQPIGSWDVSHVTGMGSMFEGATSFDQALADWDTANVTYMGGMFRDATAFNHPIGNWDVGLVTNMDYMFYGATAFNQALSAWDTGSVTSMYQTFGGAVAFNQPIGTWDVSQVTTMQGMFAGATAFNQNLGAWNIAQVSDLRNFLNACPFSTTNYNSLLNGWAGQSVPNGLQLGAPGIHYTSLGRAAHDHLTADDGWTIYDAGMLTSYMDAGPNPFEFFAQDVGFSATGTITAASGGDAELIFGADALSVTGTDAAMFSVTEDNCSGKTLPRGDVCTVTVSFSPTSIGDKTASLLFASDSPQSPYVVPLAGTGVAAVFSASPPALDFGQQLAGTTSTQRLVTITNTGNKHMAIGQYNLQLKGAFPAEFGIVSTTCRGVLLYAGQNCTVALTFTPLSAGTHTAYLEVLDSALGAPHVVNLSGTGLTVPTPSPSPTPLGSPQNLKVKATKKWAKGSWTPVTNATGYRATLTGKTKKKAINKQSQGAAAWVKWPIHLKPGSKFKVCVLAFNPALRDSSASCKKGKVPR
ncbi:MAG: BspA family leucine-rich repeat surface protein [Candidatus Nanopelagicales bacterium]